MLGFSEIIGSRIYDYYSGSVPLYALFTAGGIAALISVGYLHVRGLFHWVRQLFESRRVDIVILAALGLLVSLVDGSVGRSYYVKLVQFITPGKWLLLIATPPVVFAILIVRSWKSTPQEGDGTSPFFMSDAEIATADKDLLDLANRAKSFAERVLNEGSHDSVVFGIDAPWGIGKSSFVNLCVEYWNTQCDSRPVVFKFNPLRYESKANLLEKFIDGLIDGLQKDTFVPELSPALSRYSRLIRAKEGLSIGGIRLDLLFLSHSVEDAYGELACALARSKRKLIVIVDDLDRLPPEQVKDVLFTIKVGFPLPNISYVLCYYTDNIALGKSGAEDVREFLEKFVNVKIGLFLDPEVLARYVSTNLDIALKDHPHIDPYTLTKIRETIAAATEICNSSAFHYFQPYLGDIRKIKRLLNTIMLFEIQGTDFANCDFDKHDLLYLLLLYINFPRIFRAIYDAETNGNWGFFSAVSYGDPGYPEENPPTSGRNNKKPYANSTNYTKFVDKLTAEQRFLLDKLFSWPIPSQTPPFHLKDNEKAETSSACFNGTSGTPHNLQRYLHLIVRQAKPLKRTQQQFYLNKIAEFGNGTLIDDIFRENEFALENGEDARVRFWRILINTSSNVPWNAGPKAIKYLLKHLPDYSLINMDGTELVGFRDDAAYLLAKLLDEFGWSSSGPSRVANTPENIAEIAEWVFGDGRHTGEGILQTLSSPHRGPLGLYDLMLFRLMCSADRGSELFNLTRAIALHGDSNAPTSGDTREIAKAEMRELSQATFKIFSEQYIAPGKNIFAVIDSVTLESLAGDYYEYMQQKAHSLGVAEEQLQRQADRLRSQMKGFITFQLGNQIISSGVGCGRYDIKGKADKAGIASAVNNYLFDQCFNPELDEANCIHFLDYAIMNFEAHFGIEIESGYSFVPSIRELTKVLDRDRLTRYWAENQNRIRMVAGETMDREVITLNFTVSYRDALPGLFQTLDAIVTEPSPQ
ncbi:MAG: KAP family P-loop NTPase fold protein [Acidiferrobacteraceae bacterium]